MTQRSTNGIRPFSSPRGGLSDASWAAGAGLRKETLSRLRDRRTCEFITLEALARAVGATLTVSAEAPKGLSPDGYFPAAVDRDGEARLLDLCASGTVDSEVWRCAGPPFFMAGLADIAALARAGLVKPDALRRRAEEALGGYVGDVTRVRTSIDIACRIVEDAAPAPRKGRRR